MTTSAGDVSNPDGTAPSAHGWAGAIALLGFILVATAQASNPILARGIAGSVPPFALAFVRWSIIALGLLPFALSEIRQQRIPLRQNAWLILAAGFCGMFLCGGPVYVAGVTTTAIHIALIMALSPITVLVISGCIGLERIGPLQLVGTALALSGALLIISGGDPRVLLDLDGMRGDQLALLAMLGWSGYTLLQIRAAPRASALARVSLFAAAGALWSLPLAAIETWDSPAQVFSAKAAAAYVFAGLVPGVLAYVGFAVLAARFGSVRASLALYVGPVASAILSFGILGEPPTLIQVAGGALILIGVWASLRK
jgi:drug/metabolite transporter (DMT)-like permease